MAQIIFQVLLLTNLQTHKTLNNFLVITYQNTNLITLINLKYLLHPHQQLILKALVSALNKIYKVDLKNYDDLIIIWYYQYTFKLFLFITFIKLDT